jgi:hypothetical protein
MALKTRPRAASLRATAPPNKQALLDQLARLEARIHALLDKDEADAYDAGKHFDQIVRGMLYVEAGFPTAEAYADARFEQGYRTLRRYRRVANKFAKRVVVKHGTTKLDLALRYIEITPEDERPMDVLTMEFPTTRGPSPKTVPFAKATQRDLERAIEIALAKPTAKDGPKEARAKALRDRFQRAVAAPKGVSRHAPLVRAHVNHGTGKVRVDIVGIDEDDLVRVLRAALALARKR